MYNPPPPRCVSVIRFSGSAVEITQKIFYVKFLKILRKILLDVSKLGEIKQIYRETHSFYKSLQGIV